MPNPVCISPLKFYDSPAKQNHRKSYAHGHISPLITKLYWIPSFQFVIPTQLYAGGGALSEVLLIDAKTDTEVTNLSWLFTNIAGFSITTIDNYKVATFISNKNYAAYLKNVSTEGIYYLKLASGNGGLWTYYSEVFCFTNVTKDCLELEYWNETGNFAIKNGVIAFPNNFHFKLLLKTEIGKPEYNFEEESTKRLGYVFVESQVSKKTYKFNAVVPEYICDALRLVRLCDNKIIRCKDDEYEAITFEMEAEWQTQGDLASVTCEFETDNVVANIGGFVPDKLGGDYNNDYNEDFDSLYTSIPVDIVTGAKTDKYLSENTAVEYSYTGYNISAPIHLNSGDTLVGTLRSSQVCMLAETNSTGSSYTFIENADDSGSAKTVNYTAARDMYIAVCYDRRKKPNSIVIRQIRR